MVEFFGLLERTKAMESNLTGSTYSVAKTTSLATVDFKIKSLENKINALKKQKEQAQKLPKPIKNKTQSSTLENYMDYNQKTDGTLNTAMKRKVFCKWQWDTLRKSGSTYNYLEENK